MVLKLNLTYKITSKDCDFSKTKKTNDSEEILNEGIQKQSTFTPSRNRIEIQIIKLIF